MVTFMRWVLSDTMVGSLEKFVGGPVVWLRGCCFGLAENSCPQSGCIDRGEETDSQNERTVLHCHAYLEHPSLGQCYIPVMRILLI